MSHLAIKMVYKNLIVYTSNDRKRLSVRLMKTGIKNKTEFNLKQSDVSEIIQMALSDHIAFDDIYTQFGLNENAVKKIMRNNLKFSSYKAWRKRVSVFAKRRQFYK